ncbi:L-threonylcarbamoyladenylate synthase [Flexivirga caeni]|uniref:L-threonylcarbamoyladenylate synthase n=1 Tax=Flexivirga caeni TaxID=2294115 RepID=A0A3M9M6V3_9MICO|nr:L-threonylcarbamoyladenylate synthase [Flexivirga caeni]RNI20905.1 threonylcarbamoyl-AMP synthase [Flexivirga caeni]
MSPVFDCNVPESRDEGVRAAADAIFRGECVVIPTDTVYGIAADAFSPTAVAQLLEAKGRGREMPPPVLIPARQTVDGLAMDVPSYATRLMDAFWPGGLTLVFRAQHSLAWDLGDTNGTVGLRIPDDEIAVEVLQSTGPLAVSSANRTGKPSATTVTEAGFMLGHYVDTYLDGGERAGGVSSTILDCTKADPVVLREGAVSNEDLQRVLGDVQLVTGRAINSVADEPSYEEPTPDEPSPDEPTYDAAAPGDSPVDLDKHDTAADHAGDTPDHSDDE